MSFIGIKIQHETARLLHEIDVPGKKTDSAQLHITLLYLGKDVSIKQLSKAMTVAYDVISGFAPFRVKTSCIDSFETPEGKMKPIVAPIQSIKLHELNAALKSEFKKKKVFFDKTYNEYKPHITLSFNNEGINKTKIEPIEWSVQEIVLWGGHDGDNRIFITFPIELRQNEEIECEKK